MRGMTIPWVIFYGILIILVVALLPGLISINNAGLSGFENKSDPAYFIQAALPFIIFALYLFRPWKNTEAY